MPTTADGQSGRGDLQELQAALDNARREAAAAQAKLKEYTEKATALQRTIDELGKSKEALAKQHEAAAKEIEEARSAREALLSELQSQLSEAHRAEIDKAIAKAGADLKAMRDEVEQLRKESIDAETAANQARSNVTRLRSAFEATQAQLKQLPAQATAAKERAAKLKAAMTSAYQGGKLTEAYFLAREAEPALAEATRLMAPATESELVKSLRSQWESLSTATKEASEREARLEEARRGLNTTERNLLQAERGREAAIRRSLDELMRP